MLGILNDSTDIYTHLAIEEYLLKSVSEDIFMLWESGPAVVIGKHQNAYAEFNFHFAKRNNIPVARRLSGGGTVYHGPGNLNFTFIMNGETGRLVNFKKFVTPVIFFLESLGLKTEIGTRNDLLVNGFKFSGNAEHIYKTRTLHHGTLLFDCDLKSLNDVLNVTSGMFADKAVKSNRSEVANLSSFLNKGMQVDEFRQQMFGFLCSYFPHTQVSTLSENEFHQINILRNEKYITDSWIFAYSPDFRLKRRLYIDRKECEVEFFVRKGYISEVTVLHSPPEKYSIPLLNLTDTFYAYESINNELKESGNLSDKQIDSLMNGLFPD
jgi:lipoate---protein ligase